MEAMANHRRSDESSLKQQNFVVQHTLIEFWLMNSLVLNKVQMYMQRKYVM